MPCHLTYDKEGNLVSARCSFGKPKRCHYCRRPSSKLCDFKLRGGRTCDLPVCESCSIHSEPDTDHCKAHTEVPAFNVERGRSFEARYQSTCAHPNCRRRVAVGEQIVWLGKGTVLCSTCVAEARGQRHLDEVSA